MASNAVVRLSISQDKIPCTWTLPPLKRTFVIDTLSTSQQLPFLLSFWSISKHLAGSPPPSSSSSPMDALSTPVSSLRAGAFRSNPHPRDLPNLLKPHSSSSHLLPNLSAKPKPPSQSLSLDPHPHKPLPHLSPSSPPRLHPLSKPSTRVHHRAATGYAAALVDAARCDGALDAVDRDARRLLRAVAEQEEKGEAVTAAVESGGFYKHVVALVRMLVRKGKAGMVGEVMAEVGRICDELSGTRVVVVSSQRRMEQAELRGIAKEVARVSGAAKVRLRHVFAV